MPALCVEWQSLTGSVSLSYVAYINLVVCREGNGKKEPIKQPDLKAILVQAA